MQKKIKNFIKKNKKNILIRLFVYLIFMFFYYQLLIHLFQWSFLLKEFIISYFMIIILISWLYLFWILIDKIISIKKIYFNIWLKLFIIIFLFLPSFITFFQIHRIKIWNTIEPKIYSNYENILYKTTDNIEINWWYLTNPKWDESIIFAHWLWANKSNFLEYAKMFYIFMI